MSLRSRRTCSGTRRGSGRWLRGWRPAWSRRIRSSGSSASTHGRSPYPSAAAITAARTRFLLALIGAFAVLALGLASLGLYGVISYCGEAADARDRRACRLRATERDIVQLIFGQGLVVALAGIGLGLAGALAVTRVASSLLVGVSATDPITFAGVPALLLAVAIVASFLPPRRASRVDPNVALRDG